MRMTTRSLRHIIPVFFIHRTVVPFIVVVLVTWTTKVRRIPTIVLARTNRWIPHLRFNSSERNLLSTNQFYSLHLAWMIVPYSTSICNFLADWASTPTRWSSRVPSQNADQEEKSWRIVDVCVFVLVYLCVYRCAFQVQTRRRMTDCCVNLCCLNIAFSSSVCLFSSLCFVASMPPSKTGKQTNK